MIYKRKTTHLQFARLFELLHIALPFERTTSGKENVFVTAVNILRPCRQPCHGIVMLD